MSAIETVSLNHRPLLPERRDMGIGIVGAGFIVRDCHLVAYAEAGFRVAGITSRSIDKAREVAELRGLPRVYESLDEMLDDPAVEVVDIAVPPHEQPGVIDRVLARRASAGHPRSKAAGDVVWRGKAAGRGVQGGGRDTSGQPEHAV